MAALDRVMELNFKSEDEEQLINDKHDWTLARAFHERRHIEKIEGTETSPHTWRMKERVSIYLIMSNDKNMYDHTVLNVYVYVSKYLLEKVLIF